MLSIGDGLRLTVHCRQGRRIPRTNHWHSDPLGPKENRSDQWHIVHPSVTSYLIVECLDEQTDEQFVNETRNMQNIVFVLSEFAVLVLQQFLKCQCILEQPFRQRAREHKCGQLLDKWLNQVHCTNKHYQTIVADQRPVHPWMNTNAIRCVSDRLVERWFHNSQDNPPSMVVSRMVSREFVPVGPCSS